MAQFIKRIFLQDEVCNSLHNAEKQARTLRTAKQNNTVVQNLISISKATNAPFIIDMTLIT